MTDEKPKNQPLFKEEMKGLITVTVWENEVKRQDGTMFTVRTATLNRRYKDKDDQWQSTNTLRESDMPKAILALQEAYKKLVTHNSEEVESPEAV